MCIQPEYYEFLAVLRICFVADTYLNVTTIQYTMRRITPNLYIGNQYTPQQHSDKFDVIVTLAPEEYPESTDTYLLTDGEHEYSTFESAVETVLDAVQSEQTTLVHCQAGHSRSVSVAATVLAIVETIPIESALHQCEATGVQPHPQLLQSARTYITENTTQDPTYI